ncbi:MAG: hypothetical protein RBR78_01030 [Flavobacteriaceae bacterium]|jgi:hypothetical protein|nr:hypothetical protein [Flavobacteriaceae bacterium]
MRKMVVIFCAVFIQINCIENKAQNNGSANKESNTNSPIKGDKKSASENSWERLVMHPYKDSKGTVILEMPFPATWNIKENSKPGEVRITGSKGIKVINYSYQSFAYSPDPQIQQIYQQSGQQMRMMPNSIDELIQQDFVPWGKQNGLQFVKHYEIPEISKIDNWYDDQLFKVTPPQKKIVAIGTEWKKNNGNPVFLLIRLNSNQESGMLFWNYSCSSMEADKDYFEMAKKQLIFGIANAHYNPEPIIEYNRLEAQKVNQSWAAFNQKMAANQAAFQAQQRDFVNRSNAVNDAIMSGWKERDRASDKSHERFVDAITERTNTVNTTTGTYQKVESGYNQYWMNSDGKYISTNSHTYDPNLDNNMNNQNWQKLEEVND